MTNKTNATIEQTATTGTPGVERRAVLVQGEGGDQYLLPVEVLEACRVDETVLAALRGDGDVEGFIRYPDAGDYYIYLQDGGSPASFWAGWAWGQFTKAIAGSDAKFNVVTERAVTGVRG